MTLGTFPALVLHGVDTNPAAVRVFSKGVSDSHTK